MKHNICSSTILYHKLSNSNNSLWLIVSKTHMMELKAQALSDDCHQAKE